MQAGLYAWPVSERHFCTSWNFPDQIWASGFSWPSITPDRSAE